MSFAYVAVGGLVKLGGGPVPRMAKGVGFPVYYGAFPMEFERVASLERSGHVRSDEVKRVTYDGKKGRVVPKKRNVVNTDDWIYATDSV